MNKKIFPIILATIFFNLSGRSFADVSPKSDTGVLIIHHADELVYDGKKHTIECKGNVDIENFPYHITAEILFLTLNDEENELIKAIASKKVHISGNDIDAWGEKAIYIKGDDVLRIEGTNKNQARFNKGMNKLKGDIFIYSLKSKTIRSTNINGILKKETK